MMAIMKNNSAFNIFSVLNGNFPLVLIVKLKGLPVPFKS